MSSCFRCLTASTVLLCGLAAPHVLGKKTRTNDAVSVVSTRSAVESLWRAPADIRSRPLYWGPGGERNQPGHTFKFVKEDLSGSNPKFDIDDENGVRWRVKLGNEAQPETAASRILWAAGYYADENYLIKVLRVAGLPGRLSRGANLVQMDGTVRNARLKRHDGRKKVGEWSWEHAPFKGTREFNGLRVMMALLDNWDLKDENNAILEEHGKRIYEVSDLGASFGTTRVLLDKSKAKGNLESFEDATFVSKLTPDTVSFGTPGAPSMPYLFNPFDYEKRAHMRWVGKDINRADAKWIGGILGRLTVEQIRDAFRAAGYSEPEVDDFGRALSLRIHELNAL